MHAVTFLTIRLKETLFYYIFSIDFVIAVAKLTALNSLVSNETQQK